MPQQFVYCKRAPEGIVEIPILGAIGETVNAEDIIRDLMMFRPTEVKFVIYSPGGSAFDAIALLGYLNEKGIKSYTEIYGMCASAATLLAAHSGKSRTSMAPGSQFMIHNGSGFIQKLVDDVNDFAVNYYRDAYGWDRGKIRSFMEANEGAGTFWNADEAKKAGICSEVMNNARVAAHFTGQQPVNKGTMKVTATLVSLAAVKGNKVEVELDSAALETEAAKEILAAKEVAALATTSREAAEAKEKEAAAKVTALEAQLAEATGKVTTAEATATEVTAKLDTATKRVTALETALDKALDRPAGSPPIQVNDEGVVSPLKGPGHKVLNDGGKLLGEMFGQMSAGERLKYERDLKAAKAKAAKTA